MRIGHTITQRKKMKRTNLENRLQKCFKRRNSGKNLNILHSFHIKHNICRAHTVTSNVIFHILFNDTFDVANIICMNFMFAILYVMRMRS